MIGLLFIGFDFTEGLAALKEQIRRQRIGDSGYFFVLDATPGPHYGQLIVHPAQEGSVILNAQDADGHAFIAEMLERQQGVIRYPWMNAALNETAPRPKITIYDPYAPWNWVIGGGSYVDEFATDAVRLRQATFAASAGVLVLVGLMLVLMTRRMVSTPLRQVVGIFARIGAGDYTNALETRRQDEIGTLLTGLARMQSTLAARALADEHAARELRRITSALDKASTNMMVADPDGTLIYLNDAFHAMIREAEAEIRREVPEFRAAGLLGRNFAEFHHNPAHQHALAAGAPRHLRLPDARGRAHLQADRQSDGGRCRRAPGHGGGVDRSHRRGRRRGRIGRAAGGRGAGRLQSASEQ